MKTIFKLNQTIFLNTLICLFVCFTNTYSQKIDVKEKVKTATRTRVDGNIDKGITKGLDKIEGGLGGIFKKKDKPEKEDNKDKDVPEKEVNKKNNKPDNESSNTKVQDQNTFSTANKFDFIPGDKIIAFDDFKQDAMGDLPAKWNSTGGAEIVKVNDSEYNWVQLSGAKAFFSPQYTSKMPDNSTVDFDMIVTYNKKSSWYQKFFIEIISSAAAAAASQEAFMPSNTGVSFEIEPKSKEVNAKSYLKGETVTASNGQYSKLNTSTPIHVSIMRQQQRVKIYFDEKKVYDLPQGLAVAPNYYLRFGTFVQDEGDSETTKMYVSNLRYAVGKPDMRNKLLTDGKLITRGILFNSGSSVIQPQSAGVLKEIAAILNENPTLKVKIIGHTDSDGDNAKNLQLSEERAMAIKTILVNAYNVNEDNMTAQGKGELQPVDVNTTVAGKANNRRVEFIKL